MAENPSYDDLRALVINCTLKRSPELSHTEGLIDRSRAIMEKQGVDVTVLRAVDHDIATGVWPDMTEHGWERDEWPAIYEGCSPRTSSSSPAQSGSATTRR
jgi:hypothetical protein